MPEAKTRPTGASVRAFVDAIEDPARRADCRLLMTLMRQASGARAEMWGASIVGFGRYRMTYASGREAEWPLIGFSPRKNDLTLYLMDSFDGRDELLARLGRHKTGKSCLYLKGLAQVDRATLEELIRRSVAHMQSRREPGAD